MRRSITKSILVCLTLTAVSTIGRAQQPQFETTQIANGIYRFRYQVHNTFFVVTEDGVIAFDPLSPVAAQRYADEIRRVAPSLSLLAIVYSHDHADHASGANVLRDAFGGGTPIIAHEAARAHIGTENPDQPPPDITFAEQMSLHFGGRTIDLHYLGLNHSDNMTVAVLPEDRVAFAVDFASHDRVGYRDLGSFHFPGQFESLRKLRDLPFDRIVFGHGNVGDKSSIDRQIHYYDSLREAVEDAVQNGLSEDEAARQVTLPEFAAWGGYDDWFAMNVRGLYRWISSR